MKLKSLKIKNFRGLNDVEAAFDRDVSVIVGPNAVGKTSVLEAIRLAKGVLAPRYNGEEQQTLNDMGAFALDRINYPSIAGDVTKPLDIRLEFELTDDEITRLERQRGAVAVLHTRSVAGIQPGIPNVALAQFFSSPQGQELLNRSLAEITARVTDLRTNRRVVIELNIDPASNAVSGTDLISQEFLMVLEQGLSPATAYFAYFPADRAMPAGDVNIQLGAADAQNQLHSHIAMPAQKYNRLKNFIVGQTISGATTQEALKQDFHIIFDRLLTGRSLKGLAVSPNGPLSVLIEDTETNKVYDIDRMSSGEKGLILQFLLMRRALAKGGLVLLDEPELHLNPAICKRLVSFIVEQVIHTNEAQALVCTHSPEILADAFDRTDCRLFHLRSANDLSRVYKEDKEQVFEALRRLGTTTGDVLFSKGTLFVEGPHDSDILESGFPPRVSSYRIRQLHGRGEIEKEIKTLQEAETNGKLTEPQFIIFDRDRRPESIKSSKLVRVHQWDRYCLENFLLDGDAVFDVLQETGAGNPPQSRGEASSLLKQLAMNQISSVAAREVYSTLEPDNPGIRRSDIDASQSFEEIGKLLHKRLMSIHRQIEGLSEEQWINRFVDQCQRKADELKTSWETAWASEADGKRLLSDVHKHARCTVSLRQFKRRLIGAMAKRQTETWRVVDSHLSQLFAT
jgi:predicted ATPase